MMKAPIRHFLHLLTITLALCFTSQQARAQLQYIPETFMRDWLNGLAPGCVNGAGFLDPEYPALDTVTTASLSPNCLDLTGLQYLHHLRDLNILCIGAGIITPILPDSLERLTVGGFEFTTPLQLQAPLRYFNSWSTYSWSGTLTGPLPATLDTLIYRSDYGNATIDLMPLPEGLVDVELRMNRLTGLDAFPSTMRTFRLYTDSALCLPVLPWEMDALEITNTAVICLPNIPFVANPTNLVIPPNISLCDATSLCASTSEGALRGTVWHDTNGNGLRDVGETSMPGDAVQVEPGGMVGTLPDGRWTMPVNVGTYTLTPLPYSPYVTGISPSQLTASVTPASPIDSLNDFGYQLTPAITDVQVDMMTYQSAVGHYSSIDVTLINLGTEGVTGILTVDADLRTFNYGTLPSGADVVGNTVHWAFTDLALGEVRHYSLSFQINEDAVPGSFLTHTAEVETDATDIDPSNNTAMVNSPLLAPLDPNDKIVEPDHASSSEVVDGKDLVYIIRFQNTGNYHASRVMLTDTLSALLDPMSMRYISSSHTCSWSLLQGVLVFRFDPIFLPDSSSDPIGSQGYVKFKLHALPGLQLGDEISNVANIYFDFNPPVITSPAIFQVEEGASVEEVEQGLHVFVAPNPTSDRVMVSLTGPWGADVNLSVIDLDGKRTTYALHGPGRHALDLSGHAAGLMTIEVSDGHHRQVTRVAKY